MKKIFFRFFLCGLFFTVTTLFGVEKIYISNGYLNYCLSPDAANSAVVLYSFDIRDGECKQYYLPMTIVPEIDARNDGNKQIIKFPLAWYMNSEELLIVFHDLHSDAMGRVIFCLFSTDRTRDFDFLYFTDYYEYQNDIMKYKGFYFGVGGRVYIHGTETSSGSVTSKTTYRSRLELTDPEGNSLGRMDVDLAMSAAYSAAIPVPRLTNTSQAARLCGAKPKPTRLLLYHKHIIPHASNSSETIGSEEFFFLLFQHTALRDGCTVQLLL